MNFFLNKASVLFSFSIFTLLFPTLTHAQHALKARQFFEQKQWEDARAEATEAVGEAPQDAKNLFLLGIIEQRLDHSAEAVDAYEKGCALAPDTPIARNLSAELPALQLRARDQRRHRYGPESKGIFLGTSPVFKTALADELGSSLKSMLDGGIRFGAAQLGFGYGQGTVNGIQAESSAANTFTVVSGEGKHRVYELFGSYQFSIVEPYQGLGGFHLALPLFVGLVRNQIEIGSKSYSNMGYDMAAGLLLQYFTSQWVAFDLGASYHFGIPFWSLQDSETQGLRSKSGGGVESGMTGPALRLGISFLFGADPKED